MSDNMKLYENFRQVPETAKRTINAGRLKGKTDINPMWRIKTLTEQFGPCGTGWYVQQADRRIEEGADGCRVAVVELNLFYRLDSGEWSAPVFGTGGSMLVDKESKGRYTSDEAFKMAYTDAISVCCKMLGVGADVYWEADRTKYTGKQGASSGGERIAASPAAPRNDRVQKLICEACGKEIRPARANGQEFSVWAVAKRSRDKYGKCLCWSCAKEEAAARKAAEEGETPPWETK